MPADQVGVDEHRTGARLAVGLVGCGRWGRHVLRDLVGLGCEVHAVARSEATRERALAGGAVSIIGSVEELPEVAGIIVATPTSTHAEVIERALARCAPVFVEKPLTADATSARRLAATAPERLFVMDKWRYHPGIRELARIARNRELGEVVGIHARRVTLGRSYADVDTLWVHLPHDLAIALDILGHVPEPRVAVGEMVDGELHGATVILGEAPWVVVESSTLAPAHRRELRLVCEGGVAQLDGGYADHVAVMHSGALNEEAVERRPIAGELPLLAELRAFVGHLEGAPPPLSSAADGVAVVEAIERIRVLAGASTSLAEAHA